MERRGRGLTGIDVALSWCMNEPQFIMHIITSIQEYVHSTGVGENRHTPLHMNTGRSTITHTRTHTHTMVHWLLNLLPQMV